MDAFARSLIAIGVKHGDKVAIWATNVPQWFIAFGLQPRLALFWSQSTPPIRLMRWNTS